MFDMERVRRVVRFLQVYFPGGSDGKYLVQRRLRLLRGAPFEADFQALSELGLSKTRVCLDVGANRGQSVEAIRGQLGTEHQVISFEPNPWLSSYVDKLFARDNKVEVRNIALSDSAGECVLHIPFYKGYMYDGLASLDREEASGWLKRHMAFFREADLEVREVKSAAVPLDALNLDPSFIKIDVQGWELNVLLGAEETLRRSMPVLLIETPNDDICSFLGGLGYSPFEFHNGGFSSGVSSRQNTFFSRQPLVVT